MGVTSGADDIAMQTYLMKRGNGVYYFRRTIPTELRKALGKQEFTRSLKTKDFATAKRLCNIEASKTDEMLANAAASLGSVAEPVPISDVGYDDAAIRCEAARVASVFRRELEIAAQSGRLEERRQELAGQLELHQANLSSGFLIGCTSLRQSETYALALQAVLHPYNAPILPAVSSVPVSAGRSSAISLVDLFDLWSQGQRNKKTIDMWRRTVGHFIATCGDFAVDRYTKRDVIR